MWKIWLRNLALSLGLVATVTQGQARAWQHPVATGVPTAISPTEPIAIAVSTPMPESADMGTTGNGVTLHKPIAIARPVVRPAIIQPAAYHRPEEFRRPIARGSAPEPAVPPMRQMPQGPNIDPANVGMHTWRRADGSAVNPTVSAQEVNSTTLPAPTPVAPPVSTAVAPASVVPGNMMSPSLPAGPGGVQVGPATTVIQPGSVVVGPGVTGAPSTVIGGGAIAHSGVGDCTCSENCPQACGTGLLGGKCASGGCGHGGCAVGGCGGGCGPCGGGAFAGQGLDGSRWNISVEYLMWWLKGDNTPPLLNSGAKFDPDTYLNGPGTTLYGGRGYGEKMLSGFRVNSTYWFSEDRCWGVDFGGFFLGETRERFSIASNGVPALGRPFFSATPPGVGDDRAGQNSAEEVANLGSTQGDFSAVRTSSLWGFDIGLRRNLCTSDWFYCDLIFGYRQLGLDETLRITENVRQLRDTTNRGGAPAGTLFNITDSFGTQNRFYGGQIGFDTRFRPLPAWTIGLRTAVGIGCNQQFVDINGSYTTTLPGGVPTTVTGGLLTAPGTNIGRFPRRNFGIVPEVGVTLGYDITDWMQLYGGYNFLYWNSVVRPGEQINLNVNTTRAFGGIGNPQGPAEPSQRFAGNNFFAHGVSVGLLFRF